MGAAMAVSLMFSSAAVAQEKQSKEAQVPASMHRQSAVMLDGVRRKAIIARIGTILDEWYFDPSGAEKIKAHLQHQAQAGVYDRITSCEQFAATLTRDLKFIKNDLHMGIFFHPEPRTEAPTEKLTEAQLEARDEHMRRFFETLNYGVPKVEVLPGNIGYVELRGFPHPDWAGETVANTFAFVANTKALIIDLRNNAGGYPHTVALWASYLYAPRSPEGATQDTHLFDQTSARNKTVRQVWTVPYVPGKRYLHKPVYLLTSNTTFSGGEIFADTIKALKRGTLIGGQTAGGSNSVITRPIDAHFEMGVSFSDTVNAVTNTSLEGVGVLPDVKVSRKIARETAYLSALRGLAETEKGEGEKQQLSRLIARAESELQAAMPRPSLTGNTEFRLMGYAKAQAVFVAGNFNGWDGEALPLTRDGNTWVARLDLPPGRHPYKFVVDGKWIADPNNSVSEMDFTGNTNSVKVVQKN
jgi:hypothetical protein